MISLAVILLSVTGCKQKEVDKPNPVKVRVTTVSPVAVSGGHEFSGTVEESSGSTLSFPVAGTIKRVCVTEGQRVSRGTLIAVLDEATLQSSYNAAAATLAQAEDAYKRMKQLHDNNSLPEIQWVEVQSKLKQAQSMEEISRKNLSDGKLYAPFAGVISEKNVEAGQNVMPGVPVVKLVTINQVKVCISVPEKEMGGMEIGAPVNVTVSALNGRTFNGKIAEKGVSANKLSRSYSVKAVVDNVSGDLLPGMICDVRVNSDTEDSVIMLPCEIIQIDSDNKPFVWINVDGKAHKQFVTTGRLSSNGVEVTSGVESGDEVLTEGRQKVSEQTEITIE
jgi:RND family efflux transporter MFP subunit